MGESLSANSIISHYRILSKLGAGGMGEVWLAEDTRLGRKVALKLLPTELTEDSERVRRFTQEAKAASALNHPNIISVFDIGESTSGRFIVMEFVAGQTLRQIIATDNSVESLFSLGPQMAKALSAAHDASITHRDIKPDNIMVRNDGYVKMLDFGLARLLPTTSSDPEGATLAQQTTPGTVMGTLAYMSPEQASGQFVNAPSDVFALGVVFYELATGQHPFKSETMIGYLHAITSQTPASLTSVKPGLSPALDDLILRMLEKESDDRPTAGEVAQALIDIERHGTTSALPPRTLIKKPEVRKTTQVEEGFWIAVLPFKHRGHNPDLESLAEGLSEDIITGLSRFSHLHVIARGSTLRFTSESADVRSIGNELGARYVLDGSLRQSGSMLRLVVQLIDASTGAHLWAETFDRQARPEDIFAVQDELVPQIVSTVADWYGVLTHSMSESVRLKPLDQLTPYEALLRSFGYYERVSADDHKAARAALERAVEQSPANADLWAMLSMIYGEEHRFDYNVLPDPLGRSLQAAKRAVSIAPSNHHAHLALAQALFFRKEFDGFRNAAERSISLNPMDGSTLEYLAHLICFAGDWDYGVVLAERARKLNPNHPGWYWAVPFLNAYRKGDYVGAREFATKLLAPNDLCWAIVAALFGQLGEHESAEKALQELLALTPNYAQVGRRNLEKWYLPELVEKVIDGLQKAGLVMEGEAASSPSVSRFSSGQSRPDEGFWVAVLPFKFSSQLETLADGLSEEIVTGLSRFSYMRVISRSSTLRFIGEHSDVRSVGKELGAHYVIEGSLRLAGSLLRVSVQLVDATTGAHLWVESYKRPFSTETIFDLQDDLAARIVSTVADINGVLTHTMGEMLRNRDPKDLTPYETVLRALAYMSRLEADEHKEIRTALERVVVEAPDRADCWALLSMTYSDEFKQGFNVQPHSLDRALAAAQRAVGASPTNNLGYYSLASALFFRRDLGAFRTAAERAIALNPMDAVTTAFMGILIAYSGEWDRGCELVDKGMDLNPNHPGWFRFTTFFKEYRKKDYRAALEVALKMNMPSYYYTHAALAAAYAKLGEIDKAHTALREVLLQKPDFGAVAHESYEKWFGPGELVEDILDGLRKAGLKINEADTSLLATSTAGFNANETSFEAVVDAELSSRTPKVEPLGSQVSPPAPIEANLPKDRTRFIGRARDLQHCAKLFDDARLLTLTGLGGSGKTRLAIKLAENLLKRFPDGVWFVDLTPLTETGNVVSAVSQVLGLKEEADKSLDEQLSRHISDRKILLILDNCEQILPACAAFTDSLLSCCSEVRILTTSREPLSIAGEKIFALHPLEVPAPGSEFGTLQAADAVQLFIDRAQQVQTEFALTNSNAGSIAEICRKLDGMPLAIELAAARVKILTTEQILARLDDRFKLLSTTGNTVPTRHQTLRAVIEWSYDHLSDEEQRVSRALSVFAGGWNLPLATAVASGFEEFEMLDLHAQLVDKSIVIAEHEQNGIRRYGLLETVRQFLLEQLIKDGEFAFVRESHFNALLNLAEQGYAERITREEYWSEQLEFERDNLRVALEHARINDSESYLKLVGALAWFWIARTHLFEGREHLRLALDSSAAEPPRPARARALWGAAQILAIQGNAVETRTLMDEAVSTWRELGDNRELALALEAVGWSHFFSGKDEEALSSFEESLQLQQSNGDRHLIIRAMVGLAQILVALGRTDEAVPMSREIIEFAKQHNDKRSEHFGWHYLADCELILGHCRESLDLYKHSLGLAHALGDKVEIGCEIQGVAMSLAGLGKKELAVRFAGAVRAEWDRMGVDIKVPFWDALLERYIGTAERSMAVEDVERESNTVRNISFDEAVRLALSSN